jgi:hypothetical protein
MGYTFIEVVQGNVHLFLTNCSLMSKKTCTYFNEMRSHEGSNVSREPTSA